MTLDKTDLTERTGKLSTAKLDLVLSGIDVALGRWSERTGGCGRRGASRPVLTWAQSTRDTLAR